MARLVRRHLEPRLLEALADTPVVFLAGARQTGKSTLAQAIARRGHPADYRTLDDLAALAAAKADPEGFIGTLPTPVVLDEVQRAPELFLPIKAAVDRNRRPGRFLLTGSANPLLLPRIADALVGRMEILTLWPLSQGELAGRPEAFVDAVFANVLPAAGRPLPLRGLIDRVVAGGYPEVLARGGGPRGHRRRGDWFRNYVRTLAERDVRDIAQVEGLVQFPRLLALLAAWSGRILNFAELARVSAMPETTLKRYTALLRATFVLETLPSWGIDLGRRAIKHPKVFLTDTGLIAALQGIDAGRCAADPTLFGPLLEAFVVAELRKQLGWSRRRADLFQYRTRTGHEVDLILEETGGTIVGIEVKSTQTPGPRDFAGLRALREVAGRRLCRGVLLYPGPHILSFGEDLVAVPLPCLWQWTR